MGCTSPTQKKALSSGFGIHDKEIGLISLEVSIPQLIFFLSCVNRSYRIKREKPTLLIHKPGSLDSNLEPSSWCELSELTTIPLSHYQHFIHCCKKCSSITLSQNICLNSSPTNLPLAGW